MLDELIAELVGKYGQGTLADKIGTDDSTLSRFRSGQGSIPLRVIEEILSVSEFVLVHKTELRRIEDGIALMADLWKRERERVK